MKGLFNERYVLVYIAVSGVVVELFTLHIPPGIGKLTPFVLPRVAASAPKYAVDGYTHEEIAETLGITSSTSRSNLFKARTKLKLMIKNEEEVPDRKSGFLQLLQQQADQFNMNELAFS